MTATARLLVLRHGAAQRSSDADRDPPLTPEGLAQARAAAEAIGRDLAAAGPVRLLSSPLRRARETAAAVAGRLGLPVETAEAFGEIPWPGGQPLVERHADIRAWLGMRWQDMPQAYRLWRQHVLAAATALSGTCIVATHFVPLNVLVGEATGSAEVLAFRPANASLSRFTLSGGRLALDRLGEEDHALVEAAVGTTRLA